MSESNSRQFFKAVELEPNDTALALADVLDKLAFDQRGLMPAVAQDAHTGQVLMLAWVNRESLGVTLETGNMTYWSRSRQALWTKGETSGHVQKVVSMSFDCDGDALLCQVEQQGSACHTGRESCFYLQVDNEKNRVVIAGDANPPSA